MTIYKLLFLTTSLFYITSCTNDKAQDILTPTTPTTPGSDCDTASVISYSTQIVPIINTNCISCHGAANGGTKLHDWTNVHANASSGKLFSSVSQDGSALQMPQGAAKLSDCDIEKIRKWVAAGSPDN